MNRAQLSALGCADILPETAGKKNVAILSDLVRSSFDSKRSQKANQTWVLLVISCIPVTFNLFNGAEAASETWAKPVQPYHTSTDTFYGMKIEDLRSIAQVFSADGLDDERVRDEGPASG